MDGFTPLKAGDLTTELRLERKGDPVAAGGIVKPGSEGWDLVDIIWAQVRDLLPSRGERLADGITLANRPARIRMRHRIDITTDMRVVIDGRAMKIVAGPATLGRREATEIVAEDYPRGQA